MQSIHCKASLDDQNRRFLFKFSPLPSESGAAPVSQFNQLQNLIRTLYGIGGNFVLKYKDDEDDHILIECDEELNCAVAQSAGQLRLFIKLKGEQLVDVTTTSTTTTPTTKTTTTVVSTVSTVPSENTCSYHYGGYGHHGRGGRHGRGNGHWQGHHGHGHGYGHGHDHGHGYDHNGKHHSGQFKAEKLTSKREFFASLLNDPQLNNDELRKLKLQRKIECIDRRLATFNSTNQQEGSKYESSSSSGDEKWRKKKCDKYRKKYQENGKRPSKIRRNLTEDDKVKLKVLKTQIWELKPTLNSVKIQLGEKKALKADAKNKGDAQRTEELKKEIKQLKEIKKEHNKAVAPLKDQIRALKFEKQEC